MKTKKKDIKIYINYLVEWLRELLIVTKTNGFVVGISGGIDSALVATLIHKATSENSLGVWIDIDSSSKAKENAMKVIDNLGINHQQIDLSEIAKMMNDKIILEDLNYNDKTLELAFGNTKSRLRMTTLYQIAKINNYLVVGTSNKDEIFVGYYTKFGDGSADIYPIASLSKEEVYLLSKELKIPEDIINAKPSADLWENQNDEDELGVTYQEISAFQRGECLEQNKEKLIERYHLNSAHKRNKIVKPLEWD